MMHNDQGTQLNEGLAVTPATISAASTPSPERHSIDDGSSNRQAAGSNDKPKPHKPPVPLQRSVYIVFLTLLYAAAALYAWVITCILTHRPIGGTDYGTGLLTISFPPQALLYLQYSRSFSRIRRSSVSGSL